MRSFDIELWKAGEPIITRSGTPVEQLTYFESKKGPYKLCGTLNGLLESWTIEGFFKACKSKTDDDLFHPEPEMWVNAFQGTCSKWTGKIFKTKEEAEEFAKSESDAEHIGTYKLIKP
jgi:hypothetical protein